jgi:hypothetical protein
LDRQEALGLDSDAKLNWDFQWGLSSKSGQDEIPERKSWDPNWASC